MMKKAAPEARQWSK